jgi:hypothetical protein
MAAWATTDELREYLTQLPTTLRPTLDGPPSVDRTATLGKILDRATGIVRDAIRAMLFDPGFDYAAWPAASTRIITGHFGQYLTIPPHQAGSVTLVEWNTSAVPTEFGTFTDPWHEEANGQLYRPLSWASGWSGQLPRFRITAIWGYGPTVPDSLKEVVLELTINIWRTSDTGGFVEIVGVEGSGGIRAVAGLTKQQQATIENVTQLLYQPS